MCGDGIHYYAVEECDDGNSVDTDACPGTCKNATCGDGFLWSGMEQCDDGNNDDHDACRNTCVSATCGDGVHRTGELRRRVSAVSLIVPADLASSEECDDGNADDNDACLNTCKVATCGDGILRTGIEQCDNGASNSDTIPNACRLNCSLPSCGDGVVDSSNGEGVVC